MHGFIRVVHGRDEMVATPLKLPKTQEKGALDRSLIGDFNDAEREENGCAGPWQTSTAWDGGEDEDRHQGER
jgi:hypothetical protein